MNDHEVSRLVDILSKPPTAREPLSIWHRETSESLEKFFANRGINSRDLVSLLVGLVGYNQTGFTPENSHQDLISMYCKSNGLSHELLDLLLRKVDRSARLRDIFRICTDDYSGSTHHSHHMAFSHPVEQDMLDTIEAHLRSNGYVVFPRLLNSSSLATIYDHLRSVDMVQTLTESSNLKTQVTLDHHLPFGVVEADRDQLRFDLFNDFVETPLIRSVIQLLMGGRFDKYEVQFRRSDPYRDNSDYGQFAQSFHYDLDTNAFCKIFVYLNDVNDDNGPHCFVPGTCRPGTKSRDLIASAGYARVSDAKMYRFEGNPVVVRAPRGSVIVGNTMCWHKGMPVKLHYRDMLTFFFTSSDYCRSFGNS